MAGSDMAMDARCLVVALVGPCGSGKTTLATEIARFDHIDVVHELPPGSLDGASAYQNLDIAAVQRDFLRMRLERARAATSQILVMDRWVEEDVSVFLRLHHELGGLSVHELQRLKVFAHRCRLEIGTPDATVLMRAEPQVLRQRIQDSRPSWLVDSFDRQLELYFEFVAQITGPVLELDTTNRPRSAMPSVAAWIAGTVRLAATGSGRDIDEHCGLSWETWPVSC